MTDFLRKLMFWRRSTDGEGSGPVSSAGADDTAPPTPEQQDQLDYEAQQREEYFEERREQDESQLGTRSREDEYDRERRDMGNDVPP